MSRAVRTAAVLTAGVVIGVVLALLVPPVTTGGLRPSPPAGAPEQARGPLDHAPLDELQAVVLDELRIFTDWLEEHDAEGYIGEVGWPGDGAQDDWNRLADAWFREANAAGLWVSAWATGSWWPPDYAYLAYEVVDDGERLVPNSQAWVLELHLGTEEYRRGLNVAGAEFGTPASLDDGTEFSNEAPGVHGEDYRYPLVDDLAPLARRGFDSVRLPFRWERLQPELGAPLDAEELDRLTQAVDDAAEAGLGVILDLHNFGAYWLAEGGEGGEGRRQPVGSEAVPFAALTDVWLQLSERFAGNDGVLAYAIMNEPVALEPVDGMEPAQVWEHAAQAVVDALRDEGDDTLLMIPGYNWSHAGEWTDHHPEAWITDPADNHRYQAHHYWQDDYTDTYEATLRDAAGTG
jgi:hypothetical protein